MAWLREGPEMEKWSVYQKAVRMRLARQRAKASGQEVKVKKWYLWDGLEEPAREPRRREVTRSSDI